MDNIIKYPQEYYAICIGRSFGSNGCKVAKELQKRLRVKLYDKELLDKAAENSNIRKELFERADEKNSYDIPLVLGSSMCMPNAFYMYTNNYLSNDHLFSIQAKTIQELASKGSAIFVGRCADYVLRDHPKMLSVFISSDLETRATEVMNRLELKSIEEAKNEVEKIDKNRREYYNYYTSYHWGRADNYDLCIRIPAFGIDYAIDIIIGAMRQRGFQIE